MQRILVVDDDRTVTSLLKRSLSHEGFAVEIANSGQEGLAIAREHPPDLAILDIMMPRLAVLEVLRRLRAADSELAILTLTAIDIPTDQVQGLDRGADDYATEPFSLEALTARERARLCRPESDQPDVLRFGDLSLDTGMRRAKRGEREIDLTSTEYDLLHQFLEPAASASQRVSDGAGQGLRLRRQHERAGGVHQAAPSETRSRARIAPDPASSRHWLRAA